MSKSQLTEYEVRTLKTLLRQHDACGALSLLRWEGYEIYPTGEGDFPSPIQDWLAERGFVRRENNLGRPVYRRVKELSDAQRLRAGATDVPCAVCDKPIDPATNWTAGIHDEAYCTDCQP